MHDERTVSVRSALGPIVGSVVALGIFWLPMGVGAVEQAGYEVERAEGPFEVRRQAGRVVAATTVDGDRADAGGRAFRILFDYIGGDNRRGERIAMTAPVTQEREQRRFRIAFVMPDGATMDALPGPLDPRVTLVEEPPRRLAAIRYRGTWSSERYEEHEVRLRGWIEEQGLRPTGAEPIWARYDPPFMPWFLRRNEVLIEIEESS
jgi:hypothetical protein